MVLPIAEALSSSIFLILKAPFAKPSIFWQLAPALILWGVMEFYFGYHKREKLGWNTALGNGISLFWIIISCLQYRFSIGDVSFTNPGLLALLVIVIYALFVMFISFEHTFPEKFTYLVSSPSPIYYFSIIALLFAHDLIPVTVEVIGSILILFLLSLGVLTLMKHFLPNKDEETLEDTKESSEIEEPSEPEDEPPMQQGQPPPGYPPQQPMPPPQQPPVPPPGQPPMY